MRILIVSQYFWPENFRINDLAAGFIDKGHEVTVLTGLPNYPGGDLLPEYRANPANFFSYHNVKIIRVPHLLRGKSKLRLMLNYLTFFVSASLFGAWKLRKINYDVIFVFAVSPITIALPAILLGKLKRIPIFLWVQDLWPETLSAIGAIKSPAILNLVGTMVRWIYSNCEHLLIQSRAFLPSIKKYCVSASQQGKVLYFPNWAEQVFSNNNASPQHVLLRDENLFTILFAGNLGDAQDFPSILNAAELLKSDARIQWVIVGDGRMVEYIREEIIRRGLQNSVKLVGRFPGETMPSFFDAADVLLVTLKSDEIFSRTIPSKLQTYLAAGKPVLGMLDGEARLLVEESGAGFSCDAGDSDQLAKLVLQMSEVDKVDLANMGDKGRYYYQLHFERNALMDKLETYFQAAIAGKIPSDDIAA
jgi:glycosyltransferase involved in cell wall biosynthesis